MTSGSGRGASITSDSFKISKLGETYEFNSLDDNVEEKRTLLETTKPLVSSKKSAIKIITVPNTKILTTTANQGFVAYKIPTEMSIRSLYQVVVRISKSKINIYENLNGEVRTSTIPVTETMEVKLIDPSPSDAKKFDIVADNDSIQLVENGESITQWSWNVTPIRIGKASLKIMVSVITNGNKKETVYEDTVSVKLDIIKELIFLISEYWRWMISTLIIPFVIWLYRKHKKEKEEEEVV